LEGDLSPDPFWHLLCRTSHTQSLEYWNSFTELQAKWDIYLVLVESGYVSPLWGTCLLRQNAVQFWGQSVPEHSSSLKCKVTRGASHCGLAIYSKKYLNAKEELWKFKYFTMQKCNLQKNPLKEIKSFKIS
jgi:hypothetical protein